MIILLSIMQTRFINSTIIGLLCLAAIPAPTHAQTYKAPRTADGKPNLNGIWQVMNTVDWDLEGHAAAAGPVASLGAVFARPPGLSVVDGDEIHGPEDALR